MTNSKKHTAFFIKYKHNSIYHKLKLTHNV